MYLPISSREVGTRVLHSTRIFFRFLLYAVRYPTRAVAIHPSAYVSRRAILKRSGGGKIRIGRDCEIHDFALIDAFGGVVKINDCCSVNPFSVLYGMGGLTVGTGTRIATHVVVVSANHNFRTEHSLRAAGVRLSPIDIGENVWLGAGSRILAGVSIGANSVVGAGAVVVESVPHDSLALGVPAICRPIANR